jgi:predicted HAD superfamily phosphohydrolase YqeG/phosphatidylglycerophosphate synthase
VELPVSAIAAELEPLTPEIQQGERYIDNYRPCEHLGSIEEIDLEGHIDQGHTVFMFDAEGTVVSKDGWVVDQTVKDRLDAARNHAIKSGKQLHIFIATNKRPKDEADLWQMQAWADQIGAEQVFTPLESGQRKPSPYMLLQTMEYMERYHPDEELTHENYVMVDDKLGAGIMAANFVGVHSIYVDRRGETDLMGDRVRRVFEGVLLDQIHCRERPPEPTKFDQSHASQYQQQYSSPFEASVHLALPPEYQGKIRIHGYNPDEPVIGLSNTRLGQLRPGPISKVTGPVVDPTLRGLHAADSFIFDSELMRQHGDVIAMVATKARPEIMKLAAEATRQGKKKEALAWYTLAWALDWFDGKSARASNRGPSEEGAKADYLSDKETAKIIADAQLETTIMPKWFDIVIKAREMLRGEQREIGLREGLDTEHSTPSSRKSTLVEAVAGGIAFVAPKEARNVVFAVPAIAKLSTLSTGLDEWRIQALRKRFAAETKRNAQEYGSLRDLTIVIEKPARILRKEARRSRVLGYVGVTAGS